MFMKSPARGVLVAALLLAPLPLDAQSTARFEGRVVVEWLENEGPDRDVRLLEPFSFRDRRGDRWRVPQGSVVDGASIPRVAWTLVGSPFVGDHRRASVVHDYFCATKSRPWRAVHRMFHDALLASGTPPLRAKALYAAVYGGGPRWSPVAGAEPGQPRYVTVTPSLSPEDFQELERWISSSDPALDDLEREVDRILRR